MKIKKINRNKINWHSNPNKPKSPQQKDEVSISGHMADPSSDDNALEAAQNHGLYKHKNIKKPYKLTQDNRPKKVIYGSSKKKK